MSQHESSSESSRGLARYLYVASLVRGRRILEIGGGGAGARFLMERGARSVLCLETNGHGPAKDVRPVAGVTLHSIARSELVRSGGLLAAAGNEPFHLIFLHATPELCTQSFLAELRRLLVRDGHLVVTARSKERFAAAEGAVSYFELLDGLNQGGFAQVSMLGQSPFFGATVVPFGVSEPPLFFDDTLAPPEQPDEYVALCGPLPDRSLPYQVVKLPRQALLSESETAPKQPTPAKAEKVVERVEVPVPDPQVVAERDQLKGRLEALRAELEQRHQEVQVARAAQRGLEERLSDQHKLTQRLEEAAAALRAAESQRSELEERLRQRDRGESEATQAALLHERQMRELRLALEEREAFVAELEEQARELPRLQERLAAAQKLADESQRSERQSRQRLAEVEGLLLRARGELAERELQARLGAELEARQREVERQQRELIVQRVELEQAEQRIAERQAAVQQAEKEVQKASAERDTATVSELRQELVVAQERLRQLQAELDQRGRALADAQAELERIRREAPPRVENTAVLVAPTLGSGRRADSDGVPLLVGDMPTAPVVVGAIGGDCQPSPQQEISQLQQRIAELSAENDRLKDKITEAERETWKHMKARAEAEQAAAEVREDTVRKLRDARKLASVELMRAMEDATKKAVQLREELARTEAERKEALAQLKELRAARDTALEQAAAAKQELDSLRWTASLPTSSAHAGAGAATASLEASEERQRAMATLSEERAARQAAQQAADEAQLRVAELRSAVMALEQALAEARERSEQEQRRVEALEEELRQAGSGHRASGTTAEQLRLQQELQQQGRALAERTAERDALARLLAEVEREAAARAERARAMRVRLSEREREVEALRMELSDRERKIAALERETPPSEEVARLEADLQSARRRITELLEETSRTDQHGDDVVATALRERARAVRMGETLDQAARERDEARSRAAELEQRLRAAAAESERLRSELLRQGHEPGHAPGSLPGSANSSAEGTATEPPAGPRREV